MKGIVFTEFLDHVEEAMGPAMVEDLIDGCDLESGGVYTSVGTYPCAEMGKLLAKLSELSGIDPVTLLHGFGGRLAQTFHSAYPDHFDVACYFDFVDSIDQRIHVDVLKLYPDAELPRFVTVRRDDNCMEIDYKSSRGLEQLAYGLFVGTANIFGQTVSIESFSRVENGEKIVRFRLSTT